MQAFCNVYASDGGYRCMGLKVVAYNDSNKYLMELKKRRRMMNKNNNLDFYCLLLWLCRRAIRFAFFRVRLFNLSFGWSVFGSHAGGAQF